MRRALLLGLALLLLAATGYLLVFRAPPAPTTASGGPVPGRDVSPRPAPAATPAATGQFVLGDVEGTVEVRRGDAWVPARAGERVAPGEAIRTGDGGRAMLRSDQGDELTLRPRVELAVTSLSDAVAELTLTRGKVRAAAGGGRERLQITAAQARAVGKGGGRFTVYADPRGAVTVATEAGEVAVLAAGREVAVGPRQATTVQPGRAPADPVTVPDEVLLSVAWPAGEVHARSTTLRGQVAPGTQVRVNGADTEVKPDGSFAATVPLKRGKNPVVVQAEGILGAENRAEGSVTADTRGPPLEADPSRLYDRPEPK